MTPSVSRKPCASSMSWPGVRMVTESGAPLTPDFQWFLGGERVRLAHAPACRDLQHRAMHADPAHQATASIRTTIDFDVGVFEVSAVESSGTSAFASGK